MRAPISPVASTTSRQDVADLAVDVLSHRTILSWRALADGETARNVIRAYLDAIEPA